MCTAEGNPSMMQSADEYGLDKSTKFLARNYCLRALASHSEWMWACPQLLMISCLRLAVKVSLPNSVQRELRLVLHLLPRLLRPTE